MKKKQTLPKNNSAYGIREEYQSYRYSESMFLKFLPLAGIIVANFVIAIFLDKNSPDFSWDAANIMFTGFSFGFLSWFFYYTYVYKFKFYCPHCYKIIFGKEIKNCKCPQCNKMNKKFLNILTGCSSCKTQLRFIACPHCSESIDLHKSYDEEKIKSKINE